MTDTDEQIPEGGIGFFDAPDETLVTVIIFRRGNEQYWETAEIDMIGCFYDTNMIEAAQRKLTEQYPNYWQGCRAVIVSPYNVDSHPITFRIEPRR